MFCFNCGYQIPDNAKFCFKCGSAQNNSTEHSLKKQTNQDYEHDAIKIYLSNILTLECVKLKLESDYYDAEKELMYEENNNYVQSFPISDGYIWLAYHDNIVQLGCFNDGNYGGAYTGEYLNREEHADGNGFIKYVWGQEYITHSGEFYWGRIDSESLPLIKKTSFWWDIGGSNILEQKIRQTNARNSFLKIYSEFQQSAPQKYRDIENRIIVPLKERVSGIHNEWKKAEALLEDAYSINIIPSQYRNIHSIWYIHDYVTSSKKTLTTALQQCALEEIKQKLDTIIEQQREIIINQAILAAQNSQIIEQNQKTLNHLAQIESNTEKAAQYARIASNNAEACAWIGLANYIKN